MKKMLVIAILAVVVSFSTSCTKTVVESNVVMTDAPPTGIWSKDQIYLQTWAGFVNKSELDPVYKGSFCSNGANVNWTTGTYYTILVHKYWGIYNDKTYISQSFENISVSGDVLLRITETLKSAGSAKISLDSYPGSNPVGTIYSTWGVIP